MSKKDRLLALLVCAVFGFLGGVISNSSLISAKSSDQNSSVIKTEKLQIVNNEGKVAAEIGGQYEAGMVFYSNKGNVRLSLGVTTIRDRLDRELGREKGVDFRSGFVNVYGSDGTIIWSIPKQEVLNDLRRDRN